ncbi:MAG: signal peptidase I [Micrococcaceae bacterium]
MASHKTQTERSTLMVVLREYLLPIIIALLVVALVKNFVIRPFSIPSGSMEQTLNINDRILVDRIHKNKDIQRGDVVVFERPDDWKPEIPVQSNPVKDSLKTVGSLVGVTAKPGQDFLVKRVIGMPGDHVKTVGNQISVNGKVISEPYLFPGNNSSDIPFDITVPAGQVWVLGDHRSNSADSRYHMDGANHGMVPLSDVQGKVVYKVYPFTKMGKVSDSSQTFTGVPAASAAAQATK